MLTKLRWAKRFRTESLEKTLLIKFRRLALNIGRFINLFGDKSECRGNDGVWRRFHFDGFVNSNMARVPPVWGVKKRTRPALFGISGFTGGRGVSMVLRKLLWGG
jgi:hypothetical protein